MARLYLELITMERVLLREEADMVVAPAWGGEVGILPNHAPFITALQPGELRVKKGDEEDYIYVSGGFLEVRDNRVIILSDIAERAEEIDIEEARRRAEEAMRERPKDLARAEASLRRELSRLKVAERRRKKPQSTR